MSVAYKDLPYRSGVGILLLNDRQQIFMAQRLQEPTHVWQMPQGGIDRNETPEQTVMRELLEEVGTDNAEIITRHDPWLQYDFPQELLRNAFKGRYRGQRQKWFALRFLGTDDQINIHTAHPEFQSWRWSNPQDVIDKSVFFKTEVYKTVMRELYPRAVAIANLEL